MPERPWKALANLAIAAITAPVPATGIGASPPATSRKSRRHVDSTNAAERAYGRMWRSAGVMPASSPAAARDGIELNR